VWGGINPIGHDQTGLVLFTHLIWDQCLNETILQGAQFWQTCDLHDF